jgi:HlyD family secretion protein
MAMLGRYGAGLFRRRIEDLPMTAKKTALKLACAAAFFVGAAGAIGLWTHAPASAERARTAALSPEATPLPVRVVGLGRLEPEGETVRLTVPSGAGQSPRIGRLFVAEGDAVEAGQIVAELDNVARLDAELESARANVALKQVAVARTRAESAETRDRRRLALARAEAELEVRRIDFERFRKLGDSNFASAQLVEQKRLDAILAERTREEMQAQLRRSEALHEGTQIDIAQAQRELAVAQAALVVAQAQRADADVRSPLQGRVLQTLVRAGERVGNDGIVEIGATQRMSAIVEIYETEIARVQVGRSAQVRAPVLGPEPLEGTVARVGIAVRRQSVVNADPSANTDSRVVQVQILFDEATSRRAAAFTRLQVRAAIDAPSPAGLAPGLAEARR